MNPTRRLGLALAVLLAAACAPAAPAAPARPSATVGPAAAANPLPATSAAAAGNPPAPSGASQPAGTPRVTANAGDWERRKGAGRREGRVVVHGPGFPAFRTGIVEGLK